MKDATTLYAFNRGLVSPLALARQDLKRMALSAETQTNWMPRVLGAMMLRPGGTYIHTVKDDAATALVPFVFATTDTALIELTNSAMRVAVNDVLVSRPSVSSTVTNGTFAPTSTTVTITNATPAVFTYAGADNYADNESFSLTTTGALPDGLVVGTIYYIKSINTGANTFEASLTPGGVSVNTTSAGSGTHTMWGGGVITGWTDSDDAGAFSSGLVGSGVSLRGNGTAYATRDQQVTVIAGDQNIEHTLSIRVSRGTARLKIGSTLGGEEYLESKSLRTGYHSISFTPAGNFYIRIQASDTTATIVTSVSVAPAGNMTLTTPWVAADLQYVRHDQSGDVIFVACTGRRQMRIERQGARSWSVVEYIPKDGPFRVQNVSTTTMRVGAISGSTTLTASAPYFRASNVGSLFRLASTGQTVNKIIAAEDTFTDPIRVTGIDNGRIFLLTISTIGTSTVTLQRSVGEPGDWTDVATYATNQSVNFDDTFDNQIIYYRLGVKTGDYVALDTPDLTLVYAAGSIEGVGIVTGYTSTTVVDIDVLTAFGNTTATSTWWEGLWSSRRGWPSAVGLFDGRLWWAGSDAIRGSVSDAFDSFDDNTVGDSGPISRSIGSGPVDTINWILPLGSLLVGTQGAELVAKASSLDEPLTPTAFTLKPASTLGSSNMPALKVDTSGIYIHRNGSRVYEVALDGGTYSYVSNDLTAFIPEIGQPSFVRVSVQRQPDTRIHCVRSDGKVAILVSDRAEKVTCWILYETDGIVEDTIVLPGTVEDSVYYVVKRTINGVTKRFLEKWALESDGLGSARTVLSDSSIVWTGASSTAITGLSHLEGETVCVWANSKDLGTYVVSGGAITISEATTTAYVGLPYEANFKSARMALGSGGGNPLTQRKQISQIGLVLSNTHAQGVRYGQDAGYLDDLPLIEQGTTVDGNSIWSEYSEDAFPLNGKWSTDSRLYLQAASPRPCTVLACLIVGSGHDKL